MGHDIFRRLNGHRAIRRGYRGERADAVSLGGTILGLGCQFFGALRLERWTDRIRATMFFVSDSLPNVSAAIQHIPVDSTGAVAVPVRG